MSKIKPVLFLFLSTIFFVIFSFFSFHHALASTIVTDDIFEDTTWDLAGSPYVVQNDLLVFSGATLTIEPGVIVKLEHAGIYVFGSINANGTPELPITFTSYRDDIGGDTNGDGESYPFSNDWSQIVVNDLVGDSSFSNVNINYPYKGLVFKGTPSVYISNLSVNNFIYDGLTLYNNSHAVVDGFSSDGGSDNIAIFNNSSGEFTNVSITDSWLNESIVVFNDSSISITGGTIKDGIGDGLVFFNDAAVSLSHVVFDNLFGTALMDLGTHQPDRYPPDSLSISNSVVKDNLMGFEFYLPTTILSAVNNSISGNLEYGAVNYYPDTNYDFRGNWWGDETGPYNETLNVDGMGDAVSNNVLFDPWCKNETCTVLPIRNPVLIIPGVLGTEINKTTDTGSEKLWLDILRNIANIGDQFMDPLQFNSDLTPSDTSLTIGEVLRNPDNLFNYTEALIKEFTDQGYIEGTDLFLFPYDWRYGVNGDNINKLKQKIADILAQTGAEKVDVIAHSTGGLLVKKYVMENPTDNHIDKAIFVGVPNTGAPKAVKALIQGDSFGVPFLANEEMKKISKNLSVSYDLLPSEQYFNTKGSYIKIIETRPFSTASRDLDFEQANDFLINDHELNNQALTNAHSLHTVDFDNYDIRTAGVDLYAVDGCKTGTIGKVVEVRHYTLFNDPYSSRYQLEDTPGDGTVPLESATNLLINESNKYYALNASHAKMMSQDGIRQKIVNLIAGSSLDVNTSLVTQDISKCKLNGKAISVFSPLDIDIVDQDGNHTGLVSGGIENNIPNADFEIMGEHKFVYLPDDEGQTYTIKIKGTGSGIFTITNQNIAGNQVTQTEVFSNIPVTPSLEGQVNISDTITTLSLNNNDQPIQPSSVVNSDQSKDLISPISTSTITGLVGQPIFYRSNVNINISAFDPIIGGQESQTSGILKTVYKLDNDSSYTIYVNTIAVSSEGKHTLKFFSTDKAGNNEPEQSIVFTIDKTAPEFLIQFSLTKQDLQFTGTDNLSTAPNINALDQDDVITLTDQAGNFSQMKLKDKDRKHKLKAEIKSLVYNNQVVDITKNKLAFDWKFDKQQNLAELNQHIKSKKDFNIDAVYKDGKTSITGKDQGGKINKTLNGLTLLKISTEKGDLNWNY